MQALTANLLEFKALNNKNMKQIERQFGGEVKFATTKWPKSKIENGNY